jgi:hypothetical protein
MSRFQFLELSGFACIAAGAWVLALPAGLITTGAALVVLAWSWEGT